MSETLAIASGKGGVGKVAKNVAKVTKGKSVAAIKKAGKTTLKKVSGVKTGIKTGASNLLTKTGTKVKNVTSKIGKTKNGIPKKAINDHFQSIKNTTASKDTNENPSLPTVINASPTDSDKALLSALTLSIRIPGEFF